ncbi:hypothetical protein Scep_010202 [Stephania cephalantha]|uniref:Uncharacterized protein n=1 Tax=Stephania cephalantha TaxID=152367 RepID=A0AAP0JV05_9MAGN
MVSHHGSASLRKEMTARSSPSQRWSGVGAEPNPSDSIEKKNRAVVLCSREEEDEPEPGRFGSGELNPVRAGPSSSSRPGNEKIDDFL